MDEPQDDNLFRLVSRMYFECGGPETTPERVKQWLEKQPPAVSARVAELLVSISIASLKELVRAAESASPIPLAVLLNQQPGHPA